MGKAAFFHRESSPLSRYYSVSSIHLGVAEKIAYEQVLGHEVLCVLGSDFYNFELIIVDNGSSDGSVEHLKSRFGHDSRLKIIALEENLGTTGGKNIGIKSSKGKYVFVLNNDLYLKKQTLTKMIKIMEENEDIGILSCKLITPKGELQSEGEFFTYKHSLLKAVTPTLLEKVNKNKIIKNRVDGLNHVDWMVGAALMLKKDLIIKLNLYDEYSPAAIQIKRLAAALSREEYTPPRIWQRLWYRIKKPFLKVKPKKVSIEKYYPEKDLEKMTKIRNIQMKKKKSGKIKKI